MDFAKFAEIHGLVIDRLFVSSKIQRCGTEDHPRSKNGAYLYDGERGWVQRWDGDGEVHWWDDPNKPEPTEEQKRLWAEQRARREAEQQRNWDAATRDAARLKGLCKVQEHNYLHRKGLGHLKGLVTPDGDLFVPMHNFQSERMIGYQTIHWDHEARQWVKKMKFGSRLLNSVLRLGPKQTSEVILCEGYATGLSINCALAESGIRATVLVCFNDSNMVNIAGQLPTDIRRYCFADNDASGAGERAAKETGLAYAMSPVVGEDANDLHVRAGLHAVVQEILKARRAAILNTTTE